MTKMIDKLETDDLVLRNALSGDRRVNIVTLTEKGKQLIDDLWEGYNKILLEEINKLHQADQKDLAHTLTSWLTQMMD